MPKITIDRLAEYIRENYIGKDKENDEMPGILHQRFITFILLAAGSLFMGIIMAIMGKSMSIGWVTPLVMFAGMAAVIFLLGMVFRHRVLYFGYDIISGEVTHIKYSFGLTEKKKRQINMIHVTTEDKQIYRIPVDKKTAVIPQHSKVQVYVPKNTGIYESDGIKQPAAVWGIETVEEPVAADIAGSEEKGEGK